MDKTSTATTMYHQKYLTNCKSYYSCIYCRTHLANHDELISRSFQGNRSRAYLFNSLINIITGPAVQRELNTGSHAVADIFCSNCNTTIGWKYEKAYVESQKYKEGKFIIELAHVVRENLHLELDKRDMFLGTCGQFAPCATGSSLGSTSQQQQQQQQQQRDAKTIGQQHRGSLSPARITAGAGSGRWSSSSSGGCSSSSSSGSSGSDGIMVGTSCRGINSVARGNGNHNFDEHGGASVGDQDVGEDSDDEEEVLMFPFHDDLFGERASYSNLAATRSLGGHRRRLRRSLHLDSTPYDWKYSSISSSKSSELASRAAAAAAAAAAENPLASPSPSPTSLPSPLPSSSSPSTVESQQSEPQSQHFTSPSTSCPASASFLSAPPSPCQEQQEKSRQPDTYMQNTRSGAMVTSDDDEDLSYNGNRIVCQEHSETQFKFEHNDEPEGKEHCQSAKRAIMEGPQEANCNNNLNRNCDQSLHGHDGTSDVHRNSTSSSPPTSTFSTPPSLMSSTLRPSCSKPIGSGPEDSHCSGNSGFRATEQLGYSEESRDVDDDNDDDYSLPRLTSSKAGDSTSQTILLSLDEDEFFDCCTDHNVSNSTSAGKY